jgi:hypothetical protein
MELDSLIDAQEWKGSAGACRFMTDRLPARRSRANRVLTLCPGRLKPGTTQPTYSLARSGAIRASAARDRSLPRRPRPARGSCSRIRFSAATYSASSPVTRIALRAVVSGSDMRRRRCGTRRSGGSLSMGALDAHQLGCFSGHGDPPKAGTAHRAKMFPGGDDRRRTRHRVRGRHPSARCVPPCSRALLRQVPLLLDELLHQPLPLLLNEHQLRKERRDVRCVEMHPVDVGHVRAR